MTCQEPIVGGNCKLYYNSGTVASPTWVEISEIGDLSVPDFANTLAEIKTRASQWDAALPARKKLAVEFSYLYKADTTIWQFLRDMYWNSEIHEFAVADGDIATDRHRGAAVRCLRGKLPHHAKPGRGVHGGHRPTGPCLHV
jgi:hypothetical protein